MTRGTSSFAKHFAVRRRGAPDRLSRTAALLAAGALVLTGCTVGAPERTPPDTYPSATPTTADPTTDPSGGPTQSAPPGLEDFYAQQLDWQRCGSGLECAELRVPVDYGHPDGDTIEIGVNRLPASGTRVGSLVVNPGGPGGSGLEYVRSQAVYGGVATQRVMASYDLVGFDPRGVGQSAPIDCLDDEEMSDFLALDASPDDEAEQDAIVDASKDFAEGCEEHSGALLPFVGTRDVARDLDVLRAALGDETLTYLGKSYGTFIGAVYAGLFPANVGRMVLDGAVDPAIDTKTTVLQQAIGFEGALVAFTEWCESPASGQRCPLSGGTEAGVGQVKQLLDDIDAAPLRVGDRDLTQSLALLGVAVTLYDRTYGWPRLVTALASALAGDGRELLELSDIYTDRQSDGSYPSNQNDVIYAVNCIDHGPQDSAADIESWLPEFREKAPIFGPYVAYSELPCAFWPAPPTLDDVAIAADGAPPILVVGTTRDPATPYEQAQALADELSSGVLLTYDGDGHTAYTSGSACVDNTVDDYLLDGTVPAEGTTC